MRAIPQWRGGLPLVIPFKFAQLAAAFIGAVVLGIAAPLASPRPTRKTPPSREYQAVIAPYPRKALLRVPRRRLRQGQGRVRHAGNQRDRSSKPDLWLRVLNNTRAGLMPAEQKPRLSRRRAAEARTLDQVRRVQDRSAQSRSGPRHGAPAQSRGIPQHGARPVRRRLQHRPRIPARRHRLRFRQHRRRAHHVAHAHGEIRRGRADHRRAKPCRRRRASPSNRS